MTTTEITPYLFFGGRCDEALEFYKETIGAEVVFIMRFNESPDPPPPGMIPPGFENKVMHCTFTVAGNSIMASDGDSVGEKFKGFRLSLALPTDVEARDVFAKLAEGGSVQMEINKTFWSSCFGMVTDKFGLAWMVTVNEPMPVG